MPERIPAQAQVDQAIDWLVRLRFDTPSARDHEQFQHWLGSHPHNALAWQRVSTLGDEFGGLPGELSRRTLEGSQRQRSSRRDTLKLLSLLAVGAGLTWSAREPLGLPALLADSRTGTGERRELLGSDGSRLQLNTDSAIDLRYTNDQRLLTLVHGEVSLDSASDNRPFSIHTRIVELMTVNAQLLLRDSGQHLLLAVKRGEVTLSPSSPAPRRVTEGETLQISSTGVTHAIALHGDPWGWTEGVLSVQQMPLGEFVTELSRYRPGLLRCAAQVAGLKVSGTYQLADTEQILTLIARALPVRVEYRTRYWVSIDAA